MTKVELQSRISPEQARGKKTRKTILTVTADLLEEVGFERLSTNMVCTRAGIAPPSLYRFFPNKYTILKVLGEELMAAQNAGLETMEIRSSAVQASFFAVLRRQYEITDSFRGGPWIMRSLHAVPLLCEVRLRSHNLATEASLQRLPLEKASLAKAVLRRRARMIVEIGYAALEYTFDSYDTRPDTILKEAARVLALSYVDTFGGELK